MSCANQTAEVIQYVPFMSFVNPSFWHSLTEMKLEVDKLNESTKPIFGRFSYRSDIGPVLEVDGTSFNKQPELELAYINITGNIMNKNTIEDFKSIDKADLLNSIGVKLWTHLNNETWINDPSSLLNFYILSFADLKKYHYYYWFAFPAPNQPTLYLKEKSTNITSVLNNKQLEILAHSFKQLDVSQKCFFIVNIDNDNIIVKTLATVLQGDLDIDMTNTYFVFSDPSNSINPGWPLRIFLAVLLRHRPFLANSDIQIIGLRSDVHGGLTYSRFYTIYVPKDVKSVESAGWVGWERNDKGNFGPKLANMSASMDPVVLADTSSDLNIKLMKWRLVPDIDVEVMKTTKCLLLGAGTLGCHVARDLLAWGFRHITFLDNGKVSYSNPTRQVLFTHQDCLNGGRKKAEAAADNLKKILPTIKSKGIVAHIPMPGHPVGDSLKEETIANIKTIIGAIEEHDVIFLLLDTREARWLPTLIAAHYGKIVINAALGFDSYLVMRHGSGALGPGHAASPGHVAGPGNAVGPEHTDPKHVPGPEQGVLSSAALGCYFCNDVTAPGNSLKERTLDQQCTVTRPGAAAVAAALAVELLVALLQHPRRSEAPAPYNLKMDEELPSGLQGVLGPIPHSIRGFLHSYQTMLPTCAKFVQCIACSDKVINMYREKGTEFLMQVFNSGYYLEEVTGLSELHLAAEMTEILMLSDEED